MARRYGSIECDSCGMANDGDIFAQSIGEDFSGIKPENRRELMYFWLCRECKSDYPNGAKDYYVADFFETEPYCDDCEVEEVERWGMECIYCADEEVAAISN